MAVVVAASSFLLGDRYRVDELIGVGGMGRVYRGMHVGIRRPVAIKILQGQPDPERARSAAELFQREAFASGQLDHPNIVAVSDFGVLADGAMFLVMEVLEGESLGSRLVRDGAVPWRDAIEIMRGLLAGIQYAHDRDIVHCDLKPDNLFLANKHGEEVVKVLDFGIARLCAESDADDPAMAIGTPAYLSPEQAVGAAITPASDLYSASVVFYEMLTGFPPFNAPTATGKLEAHISCEPPAFDPALGIPAALEALVRIGLAKRPSDRFASASEFQERLDGVRDREVGGPPVSRIRARSERPRTAPIIPPEPPGLALAPTLLERPDARVPTLRTPRIRFPRTLLAVAGVVAIAGLGIVTLSRHGQPADAATTITAPAPVPAPVRVAVAAPSPPDPRVDLARAAIDHGRITSPAGDNAVELIDQIARDRPADPRIAELKTRAADVLRSAAEQLWTHDRHESAATLYADLLRIVPGDPIALSRSVPAPSAPTVARVRWLVSQIDLAILERRFVGPTGFNALEYLVELRRLDPSNDEVARLGVEVSSALKQQAKSHPEGAERLLAAANQASPPVEAKPAAAAAPATDSPRDSAGASQQVRIGAAAFAAGHLDDAERAYERALAADSGSHAALAGLGEVAYDRAAYTRAVLSAKRAVAQAPGVVAYRMLLARSYFKLLRYDDAIAQWSAVLDRDPHNKQARSNIALAKQKSGR